MSDSNSHIIPENDPDLRLARLLETDRSEITDSEDKSLLDLIDKYAKHTQKKQLIYHVDSHDLWEKIDAQLDEKPLLEEATETENQGEPAVIFTFRRYVAIAAMLLISISLLYVAQQLKTPEIEVLAEASNATEMVTLADGTAITLRNHSRLIKLEDGSYHVDGQAYFSVAKNQPEPFVVDLDGATVTVLGTEFTVVNFDDEKSVYVSEGKVRFSAADDQVELVLNQFARLSDNRIISGSDTGKTSLDWMENKLILESTSVEDLVRELELHFAISISVDENLSKEAISGALIFTSQEEVFKSLERILNASFKTQPDGNYLLVPSD